MRAPEVLGDTALQTAILEDLGSAVRYRDWLIALVAPHLSSPCLEVGSGLGLYAEDLAARGLAVTATEADPARLAVLRRRFDSHPLVAVEELAVPIEHTADYASIVSFNVLEHIDDDAGALRALAGLCRPGARVVAVVPAFPIGMSDFDRAIGHVRRYRKATLRLAAQQAGLRVVQLRHINAVGLLAWILTVRLLRRAPRDGVMLRVYDRRVVPVLRWLDSRVEPPFGQSLLLVAERSAT